MDVARTFPENKYFQPGSDGSTILYRVLDAVSSKDPTLGYVQGMNLVAGSLLFHSDGTLAYILMDAFLKEYGLREVYSNNLAGMHRKLEIIYCLIKEKLPELACVFDKHGIRVDMFASNWIIGLFSDIVPWTKIVSIPHDLSWQNIFYSYFFKQGWIYVYKVTLQLLALYKHEFTDSSDCHDALAHLKSKSTFP